ncbi:MAG: hypothetical protein AAF431_00535 [Pseudomonadota bacterium]
MTKKNMVWFNPSVAGFLATVIIAMPLSVAATQNKAGPEIANLPAPKASQQKGGWSINREATVEKAEQAPPNNELAEPQLEVESQTAEEVIGETIGEEDFGPEIAVDTADDPTNDTSNETEFSGQPEQEVAQEVSSGLDVAEASFEDLSDESLDEASEPTFQEAEAAADDSEELAEADDPSSDVEDESIDVARIANRDVIEAKQKASNLDQQFQALQRALETEFGFSEKLGEEYLGYGLLLRDAGRYEEAIEAFINALHISKVNNGIYAIEQRPALKALFETHYALDNTEDYEDYLERILWIENRNPEHRGEFSYQMLILVGNRYIDQFLRRPIAGQESVQTLLRAKHHLTAAVRHYGRNPVARLLMPYGELALISFLESKLQPDIDKTASMEDPRLRHSRHLDGRQLALSSYVDNAYARGDAYLRGYLKKAQTEQEQSHLVQALLSLGDFNQLFKKHTTAAQFYVFAWNEAQKLPSNDALRVSFQEPVALPAFNYAYERKTIVPKRANVIVPLSLNVSKTGKVEDVVLVGDDAETQEYFARARRAARRLIFRPQIVDGEPVASFNVPHDTRVYARKK